MYSIYNDGRLLYDPQIDDLAVASPEMTLEANKLGTLSFTIYPTHAEYDKLKKITSVLSVYKDDKLIYKFRPSYSRRGFKNAVKIQCEEIIACLNDFKFRPFEFTGSISQFIDMVLDSYNQRVGNDKKVLKGRILVTDNNDYVAYSSIEYLGHWEVLQSRLVKTHGGYLKARYTPNGVYLDYLRAEDLDTSTQTIDFGSNMTDLFIETSSEETFSVLVPLGAQVTAYNENGDEVQKRLTIETVNNGKDYIENAAGIALYGRRETTHVWDDVTIASNLLTKGKNYLDTIAVKFAETVELTAIDLHNVNRDVETFSFLEWVSVNSTVHNISEPYIISKIKIPLGNPSGSQLTLGEERRSLTDKILLDANSVQDSLGEIQEKVDNIKIPEVPKIIVTSVNVEYYLSTSTTELNGGTWSDTAPEWVNGKYMWSRTKTTYSNSETTYSNPTCIAGAKGQPGSNGHDGRNGSDGVSFYTWIKYADSPTSGMSDNPEGKKYIGIAYNRTSQTESTNYSDYQWSVIQGSDGIDGEDGSDGQTYYTWIRYADDANGNGISADSIGKYYIGLAYNKLTATASNKASDYKWSLFRGSDGVDGKDGTSVTILGTYESLNALKAAHPRGDLGDGYIVNGDLYVWTGSAWTDVGQIQGDAGKDGKDGLNGADGIGVSSVTEEYAITNSKTTKPANNAWSATAPTWESNKYIWTRSKIVYTNGNVAYTDPYCDSAWEAVNDLESKVNLDFNEVRQTLTEQEESLTAIIGKTQTDILLQVLETYVGKSDFAAYQSEIGTQFNQTKEAIEISAANMEKYVDTSTGDIRQYINGVQTYMRYSTDGLILGAVGSSFKTQITNERISFKQDNEEVAYISNRKLYITEAQIKNRLLFGVGETELFAWVVTETGLGLKWIGA